MLIFLMILVIALSGLLFLLKNDKSTRIKKISVYYPDEPDLSTTVDIPKHTLSLVYYESFLSIDMLQLIGRVSIDCLRRSLIALVLVPFGLISAIFLLGCLTPSMFTGENALSLYEFFTAVHNAFFVWWLLATLIVCARDVMKKKGFAYINSNLTRIFTRNFCEITQTPYLNKAAARVIN